MWCMQPADPTPECVPSMVAVAAHQGPRGATHLWCSQRRRGGEPEEREGKDPGFAARYAVCWAAHKAGRHAGGGQARRRAGKAGRHARQHTRQAGTQVVNRHAGVQVRQAGARGHLGFHPSCWAPIAGDSLGPLLNTPQPHASPPPHPPPPPPSPTPGAPHHRPGAPPTTFFWITAWVTRAASPPGSPSHHNPVRLTTLAPGSRPPATSAPPGWAGRGAAWPQSWPARARRRRP